MKPFIDDVFPTIKLCELRGGKVFDHENVTTLLTEVLPSFSQSSHRVGRSFDRLIWKEYINIDTL